MLELFKSKSEERRFKVTQDKMRDDMIQRMARIKRLIHSKETGWKDFFDLIDDYINACKKRKAHTRLDVADDKMIYQLKLLDHEIFILDFVKSIPVRYIEKVENSIRREKGREAHEQNVAIKQKRSF